MIFIVVVSCHFEKDGNGKLVLCTTTKARVRQALALGNEMNPKGGARYVATGNVPYRPGETVTLSRLIREELVTDGVPEDHIMTGEGVGIFSEARTITKDIRTSYGPAHRLEIVSSDWYLWPARKIWERRALEQNLIAFFHPVAGTGGVKTRAFYAAYGTAVVAAILAGREERLEKYMTAKQERRKTEGFNWDGCG